MNTFQLITLPILIIMILATGVASARRHISPRFGVAWITLWLGAAIAVAVPDLLVMVARWAGIGRGVDLVLYLSVLATFVAFFMTYLRFRRLDEQLTQIVRHLAISEAMREQPPARTASDALVE